MALATFVPGLVGMAYCSVVPISLNPTISMPWVLPTPFSMFMSGGIAYALLGLINYALSALIHYPFFKIADNQALAEEQGGVK